MSTYFLFEKELKIEKEVGTAIFKNSPSPIRSINFTFTEAKFSTTRKWHSNVVRKCNDVEKQFEG